MLYPTTPKPDIPVNVEVEDNTLITPLLNGVEYRRRLRLKRRRFVELTYKMRKRNELQPIYNFFNKMEGKYKDFIFEFPYEDTWENEVIGVGDGITTSYTLPFKNYTSLTVYVDGTVNTSYTVDTTGERAVLNFSTYTPPANSLITIDFTAQPRLRMRFADTLKIENTLANFVSLKVNLVEVIDYS